MIAYHFTASHITFMTRMLLFSLIWWTLSEGNLNSLWFGVPAVLVTVLLSILLIRQTTFSWSALILFIPYFLKHSFLGGIDVAMRAFHPKLPLAPDIIEYPLQLPEGLPSVFMLCIVNLLPGTLCTEMNKHILKLHVIDRHKDIIKELAAVEKRVARIFSISLQVD